ncbi:MAG: serine/threonine-protein phosphatase [Acidobacteriales bacterium]|nr:serine/threonine-protein phosphatase [Terriglobales bacterium]
MLSLLPKPVGEGDIRTAWRYAPSATLGGDSFGYHWVDEDHFALYLLDVCGHGVGSALLSVSALNVLRSQSLAGIDFRDPVAVLSAMNLAFQMSKHNNLYFTLWYGVFNRRNRRLRYCSAGHPPALLFGEPQEPVQLMTKNFFIGGFPRVEYTASDVELRPNSHLYLFSDGVYEVERPDESMWSLEELQQYLGEQPPEAGGAEMDALYKSLQQMHASEILEDDFSMVRVDFE